ncbi:MAG: hypothetical protein HY723_01050 [Chloroflexi bacterium]|nr:hypothetical protein [Chloroflexota bacterium]
MLPGGRSSLRGSNSEGGALVTTGAYLLDLTADELFEFAAAIAGVSIGLAAVLVLAVLAVVGTWRLFRHAGDASEAVLRAALEMEQLARNLGPQPAAPAQGGVEELRQEVGHLLGEQRRLQDLARNLLDTAATEAGPPSAALDDLESAVGRLDTTVGQMAASLANLIQLLERQQDRR